MEGTNEDKVLFDDKALAHAYQQNKQEEMR
jgi:hypothetical protein